MSQPREVTIRPVLNGFIVNVGCQTVLFTSLSVMCTELNRYYASPEQVEKEYQDKAINRTLEIPPAPRMPEDEARTAATQPIRRR